MKYRFGVIAMSLLLVACSKSNPDNIEVPPQNTNTPSVAEIKVEDTKKGSAELKEDDFEVQVERLVNFDVKNGTRGVLSNFELYKANLNRRKIKFTFRNEYYKDSGLVVKCIDPLKNEKQVIFNELLVAETDYIIPEESPLNIVLDCAAYDKDKKLINKRVKVLKDILISGKNEMKNLLLTADQKNEIEALVFDENSILVTDGVNLSVKAKEVISLGATIQTFTDDATAKSNEKGRSGGYIKIESKLSIGELDVVLRGESAGDREDIDRTNYNEKTFLEKIYNSLDKKLCGIGQSQEIELEIKDLTGLRGGDSGKLYFKSDDLQMDVKIIGLAGNGGKGGSSVLKSKEKRISARLEFSDDKVFVKKNFGWAYELDDRKSPEPDFAACAHTFRKCSDKGLEWEPKWTDVDYHDRCKDFPGGGHSNKGTMGTNYHFNRINLLLEELSSPTRGHTGSSGSVCSEVIKENTITCL